jgi:hypothetical protein
MHRLFVPGPLRAQRNFDFAQEGIRPGTIDEGAINAAAMLQHFIKLLLQKLLYGYQVRPPCCVAASYYSPANPAT